MFASSNNDMTHTSVIDVRTIPLSPRESIVVRFVVWGYTNKEIATRLGLR